MASQSNLVVALHHFLEHIAVFSVLLWHDVAKRRREILSDCRVPGFMSIYRDSADERISHVEDKYYKYNVKGVSYHISPPCLCRPNTD